MGQFLRCARATALAATAVVAATSGMTGPVVAKAKDKAAPAAAAAPESDASKKQKDQAAAHAAFDAGMKSYQTGKYEPAIQSFTAAVRGGGLSSIDMAHALYYRGLSYKKQSKPGLAISDLTSALWLKNGLSDSEKASATAERAEAYKLAGLGDGNSGAETVSVADPNAAGGPAKATAQTAAGASPSPAAPAVSTAESAPRAARSVEAPQEIGSVQAAASESVISGGAPKSTAVQAPATPLFTEGAADAATPAATGGSSSVAGFFSNLFGSNSSPAPAASAAPQTTASTTAASPQTSSWTVDAPAAKTASAAPKAKAIKTAALVEASPAATATPAPAKSAAAAPQIKGGKYKIHIAAMRSRAEAEALAQKLVQQHGGDLMSRTPTVDEAVIGSMGTFYRVRVGSFANADEPRGLCNTLRNSGYDCLVVTN